MYYLTPYFPLHNKNSGNTVNTHWLFSHTTYSLRKAINCSSFSSNSSIYVPNFKVHAQFKFVLGWE